MTEDQEIRRGDAVGRFLRDEHIISVFAEIREELVAQWVRTTPSELTEREGLYAQVRAFDVLQNTLKGIVDSGSRAHFEQERAAKLARNHD